MARNLYASSNVHRQLLAQKIQHNFSKMSTNTDVLFETFEDAGVITLNRPKDLNILNMSIVDRLLPKLKQWEKEKSLVIIKGAGDKAFCAGANIYPIYESGLQGGRYGNDIAKKVYTLSGIVGTYEIPYISLIDGIIMGLCVGLSVHSPYRIATERTIFATPEITIGFFPDSGSSHFLPRLPGKVGLYLALLSYRLKGLDVLKGGVATHYVDSKNLEELENALVQCKNKHDIDRVLKKFSTKVGKDFSLPHFEQINKCFDAKTVEEIIENLEEEGSSWARNCLKTLEKMCPLSLKITFKELELGSRMRLLDCLQMEYRLANHCLANTNFYEGTRAVFIDKNHKPKWIPKTLAEVTDKFVDSHFSELPDNEELKHELRCRT